jgi:hypothetical protein
MAFGKRGGGGRRSAPRESAPLYAVFTTVTRSHAAVLVDISLTGARLCSDNLPLKGEELLLSVDKVRAYGTVKWANRQQCGVAFDPPLDPEDLHLLEEKVTQGAGFNLEVKAAMDDWTLGLAR